MPYEFTLDKESLKRKFAVYVVIAKSKTDTKLYVGKTGDNRDGCNPVISRCGNHFSYNEIHSQVRNKLDDHEDREYTYVFDHFDDYVEDKDARRVSIDRINEMERWLNEEMRGIATSRTGITLLNEHKGAGYVSSQEKQKRASFRTDEAKKKIEAIVAAVRDKCG